MSIIVIGGKSSDQKLAEAKVRHSYLMLTVAASESRALLSELIDMMDQDERIVELLGDDFCGAVRDRHADLDKRMKSLQAALKKEDRTRPLAGKYDDELKVTPISVAIEAGLGQGKHGLKQSDY